MPIIRGKKVLLPWTKSSFFVFCMQNQLAFLKDIFFPTSNSDALQFIRASVVDIFPALKIWIKKVFQSLGTLFQGGLSSARIFSWLTYCSIWCTLCVSGFSTDMFLLEIAWMEYVLSGITLVEISKISECTAASVLLLSSNSTHVSQMVVINAWILVWENFQVKKEWQIQKSLDMGSSTWSEILGCSEMFLIVL